MNVGINTREDHAAFFAYHFARFGTYHLYRSYGPSLDADSAELAHILKEQSREAALAHFKVYLSRLYEVIAHELTHALREHPDSFTHAPKFYADQMELMIEPPITATQAEEWMENLRPILNP